MDCGSRIEGSYASLIHHFHDNKVGIYFILQVPMNRSNKKLEPFRVRGSS
jgi:hypothetical protein